MRATQPILLAPWLQTCYPHHRFTATQWRTRRGAGALRLEKFRANSVCRASSSCSKILEDEKYFNTAKISGQIMFFRASEGCLKFWMIKKSTFDTVNSVHTLFFRARTSCSKILNVKTIFKTMKYFRKTSVFRASASSSKTVISMQWKFPGQTLFFTASASCSKFWRKKIHLIQWIQDTLCFSGQAKVAQTSWM